MRPGKPALVGKHLVCQTRARQKPPLPELPTQPQTVQGEKSEAGKSRALLRGQQEEKEAFLLARINFSRTNAQPGPDLSGFGAVPRHTTHSRRAQGKPLPPVRARKGTGVESGWDRGGPASLCGQPDRSTLPWTRGV